MKQVRRCVVALLVAGAFGNGVGPASAAQSNDIKKLAARAFIFGSPLVASMRTFQTVGLVYPPNNLSWQTELAGPTQRAIVAPNRDTIYAVSVLDLRNGPLVFTVPAVHDRYWSFQFIDAYTEPFFYVGTRATHGDAGTYLIVGPHEKTPTPKGMKRVVAPTPQAFLLGRFFIGGSRDIPNVLALRASTTLQSLAEHNGQPPPAPISLGAPAGSPQDLLGKGDFLDELNTALTVNPPTTAKQRALVRTLAPLGIGEGTSPSTTLSGNTARDVGTALSRTAARIKAAIPQIAKPVNGWVVNRKLGHYGDDLMLRAVEAQGLWGANVPQEAIYGQARGTGKNGTLDGTKRYTITFPKGDLPPVDAFWSLTVYGGDGFLVANPYDKYSVNDRASRLDRNADASVTVTLQPDMPTASTPNWIPTPSGPFRLVARFYLPKKAIRDGSYHLPPLRVTG